MRAISFFDLTNTVKSINAQEICITPRIITIIVDGSKTLYVPTCHTKVSEIFTDAGLSNDTTWSAAETVPSSLTIKAQSVLKEKSTVWETIAYKTEITYSTELSHRQKSIQQKGKTGIVGKNIDTIIFSDGSKKHVVTSQWVKEEPITEKVTIGTKYDLQTTVIDGQTIHYWKTLNVLATSYDKTCLGCDSWTATGAYLTKGIVAVDPKVIPLHTSMYIPGYGFGKAEDTGGKIKGNRIDLGFDDLRNGGWSRRWVTIYIID